MWYGALEAATKARVEQIEHHAKMARQANEREEEISRLKKKLFDQELLIEYLIERELARKRKEQS